MLEKKLGGSFWANALNLYSLRYPIVLVDTLQWLNYRGWAFLKWYWSTSTFSREPRLPDAKRTMPERILFVLLATGMLTEVTAGGLLVYMAARYQLTGVWEFGLALIIAYPVVWGTLLGLATLLGNVVNIKQTGRILICTVLEHQVRAVRKRHQFTLIAVAGSVGKTSTKLAIAKVLSRDKKVAYQEGNFNDRVTVPLVVFGQDKPASLYNLAGWVRIFKRNHHLIRKGYPYDVAVVELGTDGPGQIAEFAYLQPDIAVVTAVAPEHMESFGTVDAVAAEELSVAVFSKRLLCNADDIERRYLADVLTSTYGLNKGRDYFATYRSQADLRGERVTFHVGGQTYVGTTAYLGDQGVKVVLCAVAVADMLGVPAGSAVAATKQLEPFAGRMRVLKGKHGATIIDDTYNASPTAIVAALDVLYKTQATKRIAVLGSMNELGETSQAAHQSVGAYCDPKKLDVVVTIGADANLYLAPIALSKGCTVVEFASPYDAGAWVAGKLEPGAVVLAKGSQNGVFAEEALKALLADSADEARLVRQSKTWLAIKHKQFSA